MKLTILFSRTEEKLCDKVVAHVTWFMENVPEGDPAQYLIAELLFRAAKKNGQFHFPSPSGIIVVFHD